MPAPDFSLRDFNLIATGSYNAGLVDFGTDPRNGQLRLVKVNDHVSKVDLNNVRMSPERILEVKETFLNALRKGGVKAADMTAIREKLGVPETVSADYSRDSQVKMLADRFRPLTRQEVRDILDKYANSGAGVGAARRRDLSYEEARAQAETSMMSKSHRQLAAKTTAAAVQTAVSYDYTLSHAIGFLTDGSLEALHKARVFGVKGVNAGNEKQAASDALRNLFAATFDAALKLQEEDVREAGPINVCGQIVRLVKNDDGTLAAKIGTGALETRLDLRADAAHFLDRLVARSLKDMDFLGGAKVFRALDQVFDRDASGLMTENDRTSRTRRFAAAVIAKKVGEDIGWPLVSGRFGNFNTGILVKIAEHALDGHDIRKEDLVRLAEEFKKDVAQLPDDLKEMLAKVVQDHPVERVFGNAEFTVKAPIVGDIAQIAAAHIPPEPPVDAPPRDIPPAEIKDFVADLVFSDETLVADVTINRPGETMRKMLSDGRKLAAFAEILRHPDILDRALSPRIAAAVKDGFAKLGALLDADFRAANHGESLAAAAGQADFPARFANFLKDPEACKGATLAKFDDILLRMAKQGCEEIQAFVNLTFKIDANLKNEAGGLTTDPYKDKPPEQIKAELKAKSLNDIMDSAATDASVPGQVGFFKQVLSDYFVRMSNADKRSAFASAMRYADTFDFGGMDEDHRKSAGMAATSKFVGAILKGTGPLLQKMMQGIPRNVLAGFSDALADMKSNLAPIPRKIVQAHLYKMINDSQGKIKSITLEKSLGAASVGEAFLCTFAYLGDNGEEKTDRMVVKIMRHDAEERVEREAKLFEEAATKIGPGMKATWDGQYEQYKTEFDFRNEARNVEEGVRLYHVWGNPTHFARAFAPDVGSMKISPLVAPTKTAMVCTLAGDQNADQYFKANIKEFQDTCSAIFEQDPATGRLKWDPATRKPILKPGVGFMQMQETMMFMNMNYNNILQGQKNLQQAAHLWFHEAFLGSGKFHGDAHAGNIMLNSFRANFIDYGNMYQLKTHYVLGEDGQPVMEEATETNDDGEKVKVMRPKVLLNERVELLRLILGATLRDKDFFLAGFEKLLSPAGKAALKANRAKAEAIVEAILAKGRFSFDVCYRLQGALNELQKLGLEMPPQINCFVQSMTRLQNTMAEMNTILNQMRTVAETVKTNPYRLPADAPARDELDLIGRIDDLSHTDAGMAPEQALGDFADEKLFVLDEDGNPTDVPLTMPHFAVEMKRVMHQMDPGEKYGRGGEFAQKVADRVSKAADPAGEALKIAHLTADHLDERSKNTFLTFAANFKKAYDGAQTANQRTAAIKTFANDFATNTALLVRMKAGPTQTFFTSPLEIPGGFAGVMMTTLFSGSDAATKMLSDNFTAPEKGKVFASMKSISVKELDLSWFAFPDTIMNAIIKDTKNLGGDDSYQIDIGV